MTAPTIDRPCWLKVTRLQDGAVSVSRSSALRDTDNWYLEAMAFVGEAQLIARQTVEDEEMMFGEAEHSLYAVKSGTT